jgi:hypothetical protein
MKKKFLVYFYRPSFKMNHSIGVIIGGNREMDNGKRPKLTLSLLPGVLAVCRLEKEASIPEWASGGIFSSVTRTGEELSVVCSQGQIPSGIRGEKGWRCLRVEGPLDFSLTGILASLTMSLAQAGISVFAISTYDTDYILVKQENLERAIEALAREGHRVRKKILE